MHRAMKIKITDLNPHLTCVLCAGYYVDATTIVECLHSFCKTCIVKYLEGSKFCPICDVQVHKTKPLLSIRSDKTLQDIVYKLVPGLFKAEMKKRRDFYALHPDAALSSASSPEDRGQVHEERFIYTPDEDISLSLEYFLGESKSLSNSVLGLVRPNQLGQDCESSNQVDPHRRYLRCTAAVTVAHLKKLIRLKYGLTTMFQVDIIHQRDVLRDDYTLVDVAYIYSWRRNGPMRFFYQIKEYQATPPKRLKLADEVTTFESEVAVVPTEKTNDVAAPMVVDVPMETSESVLSTSPTGSKENRNEVGVPVVVVDVPLAPSAKKDNAESTATVSRTKPDKCDKESTSVKDKIKDKSDSLLRISKELVVTVTPLVMATNTNGTNTSTTRAEKMNGSASKDERLSTISSLPMITTSAKENGESETSTLVSISTKEVPLSSEGTKDSVVVVVMASNEPPEIPVTSNINNTNNISCHLNGTISPSPPLQLPVPDISITPIPLSSHTSQPTEAPSRPSLPRDALLATTPQVEIIKKVAPVVATVATTSNVDTSVANSDTTVTPVTTTTTTVASATVTTSTSTPVSTSSTTTIIKTSSSDTTTITITSSSGTTITPTSVLSESNGNTNGNGVETTDEQPKHDNIGALDLSKNSRATPLRLLPPPSSSPTAASSPSPSPSHTPSPTFSMPPFLRIPSQAHVYTATKMTSPSPLTPPPPLPTFHAHSRSVPAALSAAAARPLFLTGRPPHLPVTPIQLNPLKSSPVPKSGVNGTQLSRSYSHHHHHGHHHHGGHGHHGNHQTRTAPKHILSAIGMLAVKKPDYHHRMVPEKPVSGMNNFHNGGKVDTTSSSV